MIYVAERRLSLAQPFKGWDHVRIYNPSSRQRRLKYSIVADATKDNLCLSIPAFKGRAKLMPTLRVENPMLFPV